MTKTSGDDWMTVEARGIRIGALRECLHLTVNTDMEAEKLFPSKAQQDAWSAACITIRNQIIDLMEATAADDE